MKRFALFCTLVMALSLIMAAVPAVSLAENLPVPPAPVKRVVDRLDQPLYSGVKRSWTWGIYFAATNEPYAESPGGNRAVYYYDKGRLEINNPAADQNNEFYATSGLLVKELITGQVQVGDSATQQREPANVVLAGDNPPLVADAPTYASLQDLVSWDGSWKSNDMTGKIAGLTLRKGGKVDSSMQTGSTVKYAAYDPATGHNVPDVFMKFMNSSGPVFANGRISNAPLYNPLYVFGHPVSEPYWAKVTVASKEQMVMMQAFERRLLTYTPGNPAEFQVEMGNIGRAYYQWRYSQAQPAPAADPAPAVPADNPALQLFNQTLNNMNGIKSLENDYLYNNKLEKTSEFAAPNKKRDTEFGTVNGQPATRVTIQVESRIFQAIFVNGKLNGNWVYVDTSSPLRWPSYTPITPNDDSYSFQFGPDSSINKEPTKSLVRSYVDLSGSKNTQVRQISAVTGVLLQRVTTSESSTGNSVETLNFVKYNSPFTIDAPQGAVPAQTFQNDPQPDVFTPQHQFQSEEGSLSRQFALYSRPAMSSGEVIVKFRDSNSVATQNLISETGFGETRLANGLSILKVDPANTRQIAINLNNDPRVEYAEPNFLYYPLEVIEPNDPGYSQEYSLKTLKVPRAWGISTGSDITLAIVDSGTDVSHPDLSPNVVGSFDLVDGKYPKDGPDGHGTLVAGVASGVGGNGQFGSGVAWKSKLLTYRVLGLDGGKASDVANGIRAATDAGARIINLSLGGSEKSQTIADAIQYARSKGVILIAASGNNGNDAPSYPAAFPGVISVAATGRANTPASFSSFGNTVIVSAPGVQICGTIRGGNFGCADGTSFSAPTVSGVVALMLSVNPNLNADQVKAILTMTATPAPGKKPGEFDPHYGYGTVNAFAAVRAAATNQVPAPPPGIRE